MQSFERANSSTGTTEPLPLITDIQLSKMQEVATSTHETVSRVARNTLIVGSAFIVSRLLGVVREIVIASKFGTTPDYDAYVAAFRIPDLLFLIVMSGAFGSAFIPVFAGFYARHDQAAAWKMASTILSYTLLALSITSLFVLIFAGPIMRSIVAPGLEPEQMELAIRLTRFFLLSPLLLGLGIAFKGILEAQERFALSAYAPVFYNAGIIFGAVFLTASFGVFGLAAGVIIGAFGHAGIQFFGLARGGMKFQWSLNPETPGVGEVGRLMLPRVIGQAAFQINFIVMTNFASRIGESSVGALNYAFQLFMLPYGVLALSISTVIFPLLSRQFETGSIEDMKSTMSSALRPLIFLCFPAAAGLFFFRTSIVQVLFQVGSFDAESTSLVSNALAYFALGLVGFSILETFTRMFYAMHDTRTPVIVSVSAVLLNIALSAILYRELEHGGLALAISIASTVEMLALVIVLRHRIGPLGGGIARSTLRVIVVTALFCLFAWPAGQALAEATNPASGRGVSTYLLFGYGLGVAAAVYLVLAYIFAAPELPAVARRIPVLGPKLLFIIGPRYGIHRSSV